MIKYLIFFLLPIGVFAQTYMAQIKPIDSFGIYAQTSGNIKYLNKNDEMKVVNKVIIRIDDELELKQRAIYKRELKLYEKKLIHQTRNYRRFIKIYGKSRYDKDQQYLALLDLKVNIENLKLSIAQNQDQINKKTISLKNFYLKSFDVNQGDYVAAGTKLATAYDLKQAKLTVYVNHQDYQNIKNKTLLINGKKGLGHILRIDRTLDTNFVSAHKVVISFKSKDFGKNVNVEFKSE